MMDLLPSINAEAFVLKVIQSFLHLIIEKSWHSFHIVIYSLYSYYKTHQAANILQALILIAYIYCSNSCGASARSKMAFLQKKKVPLDPFFIASLADDLQMILG